MLATTEDPNAIQDAAKQMAAIIEAQISHSLGDSGYGRAMEGLRVMREELIELEEPGVWNAFVRELKRKILKGELGGERREMWWEVRKNRLGLVEKRVSALSDVTEEEAKEVSFFLSLLVGLIAYNRIVPFFQMNGCRCWKPNAGSRTLVVNLAWRCGVSYLLKLSPPWRSPIHDCNIVRKKNTVGKVLHILSEVPGCRHDVLGGSLVA